MYQILVLSFFPYYEQALALKIAFKNSGLMDDLMVHEVIDYNKAFQNAANAANSVIKPGK